jgi:maleate isomerase
VKAMTAKSIVGALSGRRIPMPDVDAAPMPDIAAPGIIYNGTKASNFGEIDSGRCYPDVRSHQRKFGLIIPATNTSMEHELWSIIGANSDSKVIDGIGLHTVNVMTPKPQLQTEADLMEYKRQFLGGLKAAVDQALMAKPHHMIMGMSLEHIISGLEGVRAPIDEMEKHSGVAIFAWHDAVAHALKKYGAKRIGILSAFDKLGNENATRMFTDLGFEVVSSLGFACANALHIAHVPDWAKEKAILELLVTPANRLDAIVQCGTNMSLIQVSEKLEPVVGIPIIGINAATFWYALREVGFAASLSGAGRLLREF